MTIDLTGPVPSFLATCDACQQEAQLYRLIGTALVLCPACFEREHAHS
jgi:hypothetical protein